MRFYVEKYRGMYYVRDSWDHLVLASFKTNSAALSYASRLNALDAKHNGYVPPRNTELH